MAIVINEKTKLKLSTFQQKTLLRQWKKESQVGENINGSHSKYILKNGQGTLHQRGEGHIQIAKKPRKRCSSLSGVVATLCNAEPYFHFLCVSLGKELELPGSLSVLLYL